MSGGKAWGGRPRVEVVGRDTLPEQTEVVEEEEEEEDQDEAVYNRFLRQEEISDDDDDPAREWDLGESSGSEDEDEQERELVDAETVGLYTDLGPTTSAPVLLAHMTHDADFPLTRRRYGSLLNSGPLVPETPVIRTLFQSILRPRRTYYFCTASPVARAPAEPIDEARRNCVICTCDPREIICWPCRYVPCARLPSPSLHRLHAAVFQCAMGAAKFWRQDRLLPSTDVHVVDSRWRGTREFLSLEIVEICTL
jgi:hypothetical protein